MILYVRKLYYLTQSLTTIGWLAFVLWAVGRDADTWMLMLFITFAAIMTGMTAYSLFKQSRVPLVEIDERGISINNVKGAREVLTWGNLVEVNHNRWLGVRLRTLDKSVRIPTGMLTRTDVANLLLEIDGHLQRSDYRTETGL